MNIWCVWFKEILEECAWIWSKKRGKEEGWGGRRAHIITFWKGTWSWQRQTEETISQMSAETSTDEDKKREGEKKRWVKDKESDKWGKETVQNVHRRKKEGGRRRKKVKSVYERMNRGYMKQRIKKKRWEGRKKTVFVKQTQTIFLSCRLPHNSPRWEAGLHPGQVILSITPLTHRDRHFTPSENIQRTQPLNFELTETAFVPQWFLLLT